MLDFIKVCHSFKKGTIEIYPKFIIKNSTDLMIRGGDFYALYNDNTGLWTTDEYQAMGLIDKELDDYHEAHKKEFDSPVRVMHLWDSDTGMVDKWHKYVQRQMRDYYHPLDETIIFSNMETSKTDYASRKLDYPLKSCETPAYTKMMEVLYSEEERHKIEWAIGAIVSGDSKNIQKFLVFYGSAGTGKSTVLNIIQDLFKGYCSVFDAKALGSKGDAFALEPFLANPLVAIQHDGDLSRIEDNTRLNSVVSHEVMTVNAKFKSPFAARFNAFLLIGTNRPVKITDAKSGLLRRLIDVSPTGNRLSAQLYRNSVSQIKFELGGIAQHCLDVYMEDPGFYDDYVPTSMMGASNDFYNYILEMFDIFDKDDGVSLKAAWEAYDLYNKEANVTYGYSKRQFKEELKNYFETFEERMIMEDGLRVRNYYSGFIKDKFQNNTEKKPKTERAQTLKFEEQESLLDDVCCKCKAQYATEQGTPIKRWDEVKTTLTEIDTKQLHYVRLPKNHIVIDFDLKDKDGNKSFSKNLEAANKWPSTYAELSKSGEGIHLHYFYDGDVDQLSRLYSPDIEIKVFTGKSSLRRKLTKCNNLEIRTINTGLPTKGENKVVNFDVIKSEKGLRAIIAKNLRKEIHPSTKSSIDFIYKILEDAYNSELIYDVNDMRQSILSFAMNSTNQKEYCVKLVGKMKFESEIRSDAVEEYKHDEIIFYDVEVFVNLFVIVWKTINGDPVRMINPTKEQVEDLMGYKLVGFNCRRYDNHILYAASMGYSNEALYKLSQKIINSQKGNREGFFGEAYNVSYTDIYDYAAKKQSLKKWEIELGIHHQELGLPWDKPVPEELWTTVADYCVNDVVATEAVWNATQGDFTARQILAELSGLSVNDTTNSHTTRIIFGLEKHPRLEYTDLSKTFPGYTYENGQNMYRGENVGRGGYVYAEPGMYGRAVTFDVASQHPSSIIAMNCFGEYTPKFKELLDARIAIKHGDYDTAKHMMNGQIAKYLDNPENAGALTQALKIAINSVYGLTSASFDNPFRDPLNVNNIVALRGALFMVTLRDEVQKMGYRVIHIKTDSIKILDPDEKVTEFVMSFGKKYGYNFEIEHIFEKICLVNDAVYIAKLADDDPDYIKDLKKHPDTAIKWTATGAQFQQPYVFKTLFSKQLLEFDDFCETKSATKGELYLDMNEGLADGEHNYQFIGRVGQFCPIKNGCGGGVLYRIQDEKNYAVTGTKGYRWLESEVVRTLDKQEDIDEEYYIKLVDEAVATISEFGDFEWLTD